MTVMTIGEVAQHSGLSEPTLRYYEQVDLVGPIERDETSGHRRYDQTDLDSFEALACMRAVGASIEDMRVYQANRRRGRAAAAQQRELLLRHAERIEAEMAAQRLRLRFLREKAAMWGALDRGDAEAQAAATRRWWAAARRMVFGA